MAWVEPVTLERHPVRLVPLAMNHAPALAAAASDGELWKLTVTSVPDPGHEAAYIDTALRMRNEGHRLAFAVIDSRSGDIIGSTSYHDIVAPIRRLEIGYTWYAQRCQRTAVNTTCKLLLLQHAFDTLGAQLVGWRTDGLNFRSQAAIERLGAHKDGTLRHHALRRDGTVRDTVMYSLLASEWPAVRERLEQRLMNAPV
jgi:RimJ/RimL family protein N-acetyltransferase